MTAKGLSNQNELSNLNVEEKQNKFYQYLSSIGFQRLSREENKEYFKKLQTAVIFFNENSKFFHKKINSNDYSNDFIIKRINSLPLDSLYYDSECYFEMNETK